MIKDDIIKIEKEKPKRHWALNCLFILIGLFLLLILVLAILFATSGLVKIPVLSFIFYHPEKEIVLPYELDLEKKFEEAIKQGQKTAEVEFTEEEITGLLQETAKESIKEKKEEIKIENPQVKIKPDYIKIWAKIYFPHNLPVFQHETYITVTFLPVLENQMLRIEIKKLKIGSLPISSIFIKQILNYLEKKGAKLVFEAKGLEDLELSQGKIKIKFDVESFSGGLREEIKK